MKVGVAILAAIVLFMANGAVAALTGGEVLTVIPAEDLLSLPLDAASFPATFTVVEEPAAAPVTTFTPEDVRDLLEGGQEGVVDECALASCLEVNEKCGWCLSGSRNFGVGYQKTTEVLEDRKRTTIKLERACTGSFVFDPAKCPEAAQGPVPPPPPPLEVPAETTEVLQLAPDAAGTTLVEETTTEPTVLNLGTFEVTG